MAADEKYFEDTYSKLEEYLLKKGYRKELLKKGYRKEFILKWSVQEDRMIAGGIRNVVFVNFNEVYHIIEEGDLEGIKVIIEGLQNQSSNLFPANANYYAVISTAMRSASWRM